MMKNALTVACALALGLSFLPACGGGGSSDGGGGKMDVSSVSNGFGDVLPYRIKRVDPATGMAAMPEERLQITSKQILFDNATPLNKVLPPAQFPESAVLPSNLPGNQGVREGIVAEYRRHDRASPGLQRRDPAGDNFFAA
jgi:hypothetical protein